MGGRQGAYKNWYESLLPVRPFTLLDLGCGEQNFSRYFPFVSCTAVDLKEKYRKSISKKADFICADVIEFLLNTTQTWDVVVALDVPEHLVKDRAIILLEQMKNHADKLVIAKMPDGFARNPGFDGTNDLLQVHRCGFSQQELETMGFSVRRIVNGRLGLKPVHDKLNVSYPISWDILIASWRPDGA